MDYQLVFMTASGMDEAERIADVLVNGSLAACVNIVGGCRSIYRWKGELVRDEEVLMIAKTRQRDFDAIVDAVTGLHSYDVPEIIAADLANLSDGYAGFLKDSLGG
ncbi:MAG: divalent-cation tolerance protein CutA [bacterium]